MLVRGVGGCSEARRGNESPLSLPVSGSLSLSLLLPVLRYGTGAVGRGTLLPPVRSPAPDEQIRNTGGRNIDLG